MNAKRLHVSVVVRDDKNRFGVINLTGKKWLNISDGEAMKKFKPQSISSITVSYNNGTWHWPA